MGMVAILLSACHPSGKQENKEVSADSSLLPTPDTVPITVVDSTVIVAADTVTFDAGMLIGKWLQPVPGKDNEWQGMELRKGGKAIAVNMYSLVYEKWELQHDTLLLWNHAEGGKSKDSTRAIDTSIIRDLTDTSLVLYPVKAAEGYLEKYHKEVRGKKAKHK